MFFGKNIDLNYVFKKENGIVKELLNDTNNV